MKIIRLVYFSLLIWILIASTAANAFNYQITIEDIQKSLTDLSSSETNLSQIILDRIEEVLTAQNITLQSEGMIIKGELPGVHIKEHYSLESNDYTVNLYSNSQGSIIFNDLNDIQIKFEVDGHIDFDSSLHHEVVYLGLWHHTNKYDTDIDADVSIVLIASISFNPEPIKDAYGALRYIQIDPKVDLKGYIKSLRNLDLDIDYDLWDFLSEMSLETLSFPFTIFDILDDDTVYLTDVIPYTNPFILATLKLFDELLELGGPESWILQPILDNQGENWADSKLQDWCKEKEIEIADRIKGCLGPPPYQIILPIITEETFSGIIKIIDWIPSRFPLTFEYLYDHRADIIYYLLIGDKENLYNTLATSAGCEASYELKSDMPVMAPRPPDSEFYETPYVDFCTEITTKDMLGNAAVWHTGGLQSDRTAWTLYPGTQFDIGVLSIEDNYQPYMQRVLYNEVPVFYVPFPFYIPRGTGTCKLEMRVYKKDISATGLKPLIAIHGGSWKYRGFGFFGLEAQISNLTERGFVVFAPFYRLAGDQDGNEECNCAKWYEIVSDIEAALTWVETHAAEYGASGPIRVMGQSAGAHLAGWLAVHRPDEIDRALLLYPPADLSDYLENPTANDQARSAVETFIGQELEDIDPASDVVYLNSFPELIASNPDKYPPMFIIHGCADSLVPSRQSVRLCNALNGNPDIGPAIDNGGDPSNGTFREAYMCDNRGSQLHLFAEGEHMLDGCIEGYNMLDSYIPNSLCPAGSDESRLNIAMTLEDAYYWLANDPPEILYPVEDSEFKQGREYTIKWTNFPPSCSHVKIELYRGSILVETLISSTQNDGLYTWSIPNDQEVDMNYKIIVSSTSDASEYAESALLRISGALQVSYPSDSGIVWNQGKSYRISWNGHPTFDSVKIELYKGSSLISTIDDDNSDGDYSCHIPDDMTPGSDYKVKITSNNDTSQYDYSDHCFSIVATPMVTSPSGSSKWDWGETHSIEWKDFPGSTVSINLCRNSSYVLSIDSSAPNTGKYSWTVPNDLRKSSTYQIKVSSNSSGDSVSDFSSEFMIPDIFPEVMYPSKPDISFQMSGCYKIEWRNFPGADVKIELYKGSVFERIIVPSSKNISQNWAVNYYNWKVPKDLAAGKNYCIRITSNAYPNASHVSENPFEILSPPKVKYPSAQGIVWHQGREYTITWINFIGSYATIELLKDGSLYKTIIRSARNNGSYTWTVPDDIPPGSDYKIRIKSTISDVSNNCFTILRPPTLIYPSQYGIIWLNGESYTITWRCFTGADVKIELFSGTCFRGDSYICNRIMTITPSTPNNGSYTWTVPTDLHPSSDYCIKITSNKDPTIFAFSEGNLEISPPPKVVRPSAPGIFWNPGDCHLILWNFPCSTAMVRIDLYKGATLIQTIAPSTSNDGSYTWCIPQDYILGVDFKIKITSTYDDSIFAYSDSCFGIVFPQVKNPSEPGIIWNRGGYYPIIWRAFSDENVTIQLYMQQDADGSLWYLRTIAASTKNDGSYTWHVPMDLTPNLKYRIKVASPDGSEQDYSDNYFVIL